MSGNCLKLLTIQITKKNKLVPTSGIKNCRELCNLQVHHPHQHLCSLINYSPAIGSFSYHHRYAQLN